MYPLLEKDGLAIAYWATQLGFNLLIAPHCSLTEMTSILAVNTAKAGGVGANWWGRLATQAHYASLLGMLGIHAVSAFNEPPPRYPDLWTYLYAVYSCVHLLGFYGYFTLGQWLATLAPNTAETTGDAAPGAAAGTKTSTTVGTKKQASESSGGGLRVAFIHPDLGIGGAERLVVDAAVGLQSLGHSVTIYTAHHDPSHCFEETRDGTLAVKVHGDWLPRATCGRCMALWAYIRVFWVSFRVLWLQQLSNGNPEQQRFDCLVVDQVSHAVPLVCTTLRVCP